MLGDGNAKLSPAQLRDVAHVVHLHLLLAAWGDGICCLVCSDKVEILCTPRVANHSLHLAQVIPDVSNP